MDLNLDSPRQSAPQAVQSRAKWSRLVHLALTHQVECIAAAEKAGTCAQVPEWVQLVARMASSEITLDAGVPFDRHYIHGYLTRALPAANLAGGDKHMGALMKWLQEES